MQYGISTLNAVKTFAMLVAMFAACLLLSAEPAQASTFTVNSTDSFERDASRDDGVCDVDLAAEGNQCTLMAAIGQANASAGADTIGFDIPETDPGRDPTTGVFTISPTAQLPNITDTLTIDGYTQPGASPNALEKGSDAKLLIELDGGSDLLQGPTIKASDSVVRGLVINNFLGSGVVISGTDNWVAGNHILGTGGHCCSIGAGVVVTGSNSTVGGTSPNARNIISSNGAGISIVGRRNKVQGNYIGTDTSGTKDLGNKYYGVGISNALNSVGGTSAGAGNVISGNGHDGVMVSDFDFDANQNKVQGNLIGTEADGTGPLGNGWHGVRIERGSNNTIGGTTAGAANTIAFNRRIGVLIRHGSGNRIYSNSIFANGDLGIDLLGRAREGSGRTLNDPGDADKGANALQNFPVITSATSTSSATTIKGKLNSTPNKNFLIQFFFSPAPDPSGFGEGKTFIGQKSVTTNADGNATFTFTPLKRVPVGWVVTATATDPNGNTSEFSKARAVTQP